MTQNVDENNCILFFETTKAKVIAASHNYPDPCCMFSSGGVLSGQKAILNYLLKRKLTRKD